MKNLIWVILVLFIFSACSRSENEESTHNNNYVGKWYLKKVISPNGTEDTSGTCAAKTNFNITSIGNVTFTEYNNMNNCGENAVYSGVYNDASKSLKINNYQSLASGDFTVEFVAKNMNLTQSFKMPGSNTTHTITYVTEK